MLLTAIIHEELPQAEHSPMLETQQMKWPLMRTLKTKYLKGHLTCCSITILNYFEEKTAEVYPWWKK